MEMSTLSTVFIKDYQKPLDCKTSHSSYTSFAALLIIIYACSLLAYTEAVWRKPNLCNLWKIAQSGTQIIYASQKESHS